MVVEFCLNTVCTNCSEILPNVLGIPFIRYIKNIPSITEISRELGDLLLTFASNIFDIVNLLVLHIDPSIRHNDKGAGYFKTSPSSNFRSKGIDNIFAKKSLWTRSSSVLPANFFLLLVANVETLFIS